MPTTTITLKVPVEHKRRLQSQARKAKQSLNAYLLGHLLAPNTSQTKRGRPDYAKITACMAAEHATLRFVDHLER